MPFRACDDVKASRTLQDIHMSIHEAMADLGEVHWVQVHPLGSQKGKTFYLKKFTIYKLNKKPK